MPLSTIDSTGLSNPFGAPTGGNVMASWTTAGRPATPSTGQYGYNTTYGGVEVYNGSAWSTITGGPAFQVNIGSAQTISSTTFTKLQYNTVVFDTNSNFNTSTNRFTPTVAGYYLVIAAFQSASGSPTQMVCGIYKNGSAYMYGNNVVATAPQALNVTALVYCNGSTDYLEACGYQTAAGSFLALSTATYFQGYLARSA